MNDELLTIEMVGSRLKISRAHVYKLINAKKIRVCKIGTRGVRVRASEVERFIEANTVGDDSE